MRITFGAIILAFFLCLSGTVAQAQTSEDEGDVVIVTVDSTNLRFSPETVTITEGDAIRFFWSGEILAHNAVAENGLFDSGEASRNVDYTFVFERGNNGTHQYVCEPHEAFGMVGTIVVNPAPQEEVNPVDDEKEIGSVPGFASFITMISLTFAAITSRHGDRK